MDTAKSFQKYQQNQIAIKGNAQTPKIDDNLFVQVPMGKNEDENDNVEFKTYRLVKR